jgi:hypothetical protein
MSSQPPVETGTASSLPSAEDPIEPLTAEEYRQAMWETLDVAE